MRARRTVTRAVALLVAAVGAALITPAVAAAAPKVANDPYPAPPPSLTVSSAAVTTGKSVRVSGSGFASKEPVSITVRYRITLRSASFHPPFGGHAVGRADGQGKVKSTVALKFPGYATITVRGIKSHKSASVTVRVLAWRGAWPAHFKPASATSSDRDGAVGGEIIAGLLGITAMIGSGLVGARAVRRRRA